LQALHDEHDGAIGLIVETAEQGVGVPLLEVEPTRRIIWQNFAGTIAVDTVGVALASVGFLNPLLAAFIHVASELVFISNSARLLPSPEQFVGAVSRPAPAQAQLA
jgi:hypothetical protein